MPRISLPPSTTTNLISKGGAPSLIRIAVPEQSSLIVYVPVPGRSGGPPGDRTVDIVNSGRVTLSVEGAQGHTDHLLQRAPAADRKVWFRSEWFRTCPFKDARLQRCPSRFASGQQARYSHHHAHKFHHSHSPSVEISESSRLACPG